MNDDEGELPYEVASSPAYEVMRGITDSLPKILAILRVALCDGALVHGEFTVAIHGDPVIAVCQFKLTREDEEDGDGRG